MIKNNCILILIALLFFTTTKSSENSLINRTKNIEKVDSCFDQLNKDLIDNVLVSLGANNKLFVCYSGYKIVDYWESSAGYRIKPIVGGTSNILTEIDLCTKKEYVFDQRDDLSDIMNNPQCQHASPVNDIARWKDNYYVAHGSSIYIYRSTNPWFTSPRLSKINQFTANLANNDIIKKIFIDKDDNILAVSSCGIILKNAVANSVSMPIIAQSFPANQILYSCDYNSANNMVLLGGNNFVQIVLLNNPIKTFTLAMDQLRIHTIDTNDNYILLSDVVPNTNRRDIHAHKGHLKAENCCVENETPYEQWQECQKCTQNKIEWKKNKEIFLNTPSTISHTGTPQEILAAVQKRCTYGIAYPKACTHRICPHSDTLIASCKQNTILLLSLSKVMDKVFQKPELSNIDLANSPLIEHRIDHKDKSSAKSEAITRISHISLTKNFLLIAKSIVHNYNYFCDYIYNIPLEKIESMQSSQKPHIGFDFLADAYAASSLNWKPLYDASRDGDSMRICKNRENGEKICAGSIVCQNIVCGNPEYTFQYVANANLFTHHDDKITFNLTESLKRMSRNLIFSCMRNYEIILSDRRIQLAIAGMIACSIGIIKCVIEIEKNSPALRL